MTEVCNLSVSIFEEGKGVGFKEGREDMMRENVINLASAGFSPEKISDLLKVSVKQVRKWINH